MIRLRWINASYNRTSYAAAILGSMADFIIPACHFAGSEGFEVEVLNDMGWDYVIIAVERDIDAVKMRLRFPDLEIYDEK